jgi:hypothetical protein
MPYDGVTYLCCTDCGEYVIEGEAEAHERGCRGVTTSDPPLVCRLCQARVDRSHLRDHLAGHSLHAEDLEPDEVRDEFEADEAPVEGGDNSAFLGCLTGTVKFGPGWDKPLPPEDGEFLRGT